MNGKSRAIAVWAVILIGLVIWPIGARATEEVDAQAQYMKADELEAVGQYADAITEWQRVFANYSDQPRVCANAKLAIGRAKLALGQTDNAEVLFRDLMATYPRFHRQSAEALLELGRIHEGRNLSAPALADYRAVIRDYSGMTGQCAEAKLRIGARLVASGDTANGLRELSFVIEDYPTVREYCAEASLRIGGVLYGKNRTDEAIAQFQKVLADYGDLQMWNAEALLRLGASQQKAGTSDDAHASYDKILKDYPDFRPQCVKATVGKALVYESAGEPAAAITQYLKILKLYPGFQDQADSAKERVQALQPTANLSADAQEKVRSAFAYYEQVRTEKAMDSAAQDLAEMAGVAPDYPNLREKRVEQIMRNGRALAVHGQYEQAKAQFGKILAQYDDTVVWCAEATVEIGKTERKAEHLGEALTVFAKVVTDYPSASSECADATLYRGEVYEQLGDNETAVKEYRDVAKNYADNKGRAGQAQYQSGCLLNKTGDKEEALAEFEKLYSDPSSLPEYAADGLEAAVRILLGQKKHKDAVAAADTVIALHASRPRSRHDLRPLLLKASVQFDARRYGDSDATTRTIISEHADVSLVSGPARILQVQSLLMDRKPDQALPLLTAMPSAETWSQADLALIAQYTAFCYKLTDSAKAEELLSAVISNYGDTWAGKDSYFHRAVLRANRGAYAEAAADIQATIAPHLKHYASAHLLQAQGKYAEAAAEYAQVMPSLPAGYNGSWCEPVEAQEHLAMCYRKMGDDPRADAAFKKFMELHKEHMAPAY